MPTYYKGTEEERRALDAFVKLSRAAESVEGAVNAHLAADGLSVSQFGALEALYHRGPMCQKELGGKLLKSGGNMTMVVDNLEKPGLVKRVRDVADRRLISVHLTDEGRDTVEAVLPGHVRGIVAAMSALAPEEQETLGRLCRTLGLSAGSGPAGSEKEGSKHK